MSSGGSILSSIPSYVTALLIVVILGTQLRLLPIAEMRGSSSPSVAPGFHLEYIADILFHAVLPVLVYFIATVGHWILSMKSATLATLEEDYVTAARARGLSDGRITTAYVGRNAVLPLVSQFAITAGHVVGGAFFIETILVYPGIGLRLYKSIEQRDYTLMQGIVLLLTVSVVVANLLADVLYAKLDPRIGRAAGRTMSVAALSDRPRAPGSQARSPRFLTSCDFFEKSRSGCRAYRSPFFVVLAFIVPLFVPYQDAVDVTAIYQPPSAAHPLGTDSSGRDVWNQIIHGGRDILLVGFVAGFFSTLIAVSFGSLAAVAGGKVDALISGRPPSG